MTVQYVGDFAEDSTIYIPFNTFDSNDPAQSATITNLTDADIKVHKDGGLTQIAVDGATVAINYDGITGNHLITIDTSVSADYTTGSDYLVRIEGTTVDAGTINAFVGSFSIQNRYNGISTTAFGNLQATYDGTGYTDDNAPATQLQIGNLSTGAGGLSTTASSATITTGTPTLTYTATQSLDLIYHEVAAVGGNTDFYYEFDIGGDGTATDILWDGYIQSQGDNVTVEGYDWVAAGWSQVGSLAGANNTTRVEEDFKFTVAMTGTGANIGKVRIRFSSTDATNVATDRILVLYSIVSRTTGYSKGAVWLNTNGSNTSTESYVDGVADRSVSTIAAANTIMTNLDLSNLEVSAGSSVTLTAAQNNIFMRGENWALAMGGQSVSGSYVLGATISGIMTAASNTIFEDCIVNASTVDPCTMRACYWGSTITLGSAGDYYFNDCKSRIAGTGSPVIDMGAGVGATNVSIRNYSGGLTINNIAAGDVISVGGPDMGTVTLNGADGTVDVRGTGKPIVDNRTGSPTLITTGHAITSLAELKGSGFVEATDSNEAIRDRGDTDWTGGGSAPTVVQIRQEMDSNSTQLAKIGTPSVSLAADIAGIASTVLPTQNVVFNNIEFLWVAASDHVTPVTGASTTSVTRSIDGGAFASATGTLSEVGNGIYSFDASAADMNGGTITFRFVATGGTPGAPDDAFVTIITDGGV